MKRLNEYIKEAKSTVQPVERYDDAIDEGLIGDFFRGLGSIMKTTAEKGINAVFGFLGGVGSLLKSGIENRLYKSREKTRWMSKYDNIGAMNGKLTTPLMNMAKRSGCKTGEDVANIERKINEQAWAIIANCIRSTYGMNDEESKGRAFFNAAKTLIKNDTDPDKFVTQVFDLCNSKDYSSKELSVSKCGIMIGLGIMCTYSSDEVLKKNVLNNVKAAIDGFRQYYIDIESSGMNDKEALYENVQDAVDQLNKSGYTELYKYFDKVIKENKPKHTADVTQ